MAQVANDSISDAQHARIEAFINDVAGIQLPRHKRNLIEARLRRRQKILARPSLRDYLDYALAPDSQRSK